MASSQESDEEDITPRPLRVKALQGSNPAPFRIPQRSSSCYFPHSASPARQNAFGLDSTLPCLVPSPADLPCLTVIKSRRSDIGGSRSNDDDVSARLRQYFPELPSAFRRISSNTSGSCADNTEKDELDDVSQQSRVSSLCSRSKKKSADELFTRTKDDIDESKHCKTISRSSRLRTCKQRLLHKVGASFRPNFTGDDSIKNESQQITDDPDLYHGHRERRISSDSDGTTVSTQGSLFDYPSPLSTPTRSSFAARTGTTSVGNASRTSSVSINRRSTRPILALKLVLTPELNRVAMDCENNMFVAIDVEPTIEPACPTSLGAADPALRIAAIVDNSILTSPASLNTSREAISYIASQLHHPQDRLAILATHGCNTESGPHVILPIEFASAQRVRLIVDSITLYSTKTDTRIIEALAVAANLLVEKPTEINTAFNHLSLRHVIVFTTDPCAVSLNTHQIDELVTVHFVNSGLVPWKTLAAPSTHRWIITNDLLSPLSTEKLDHSDFHRKLGNMLIDMRHYHDHGSLTNIVLKIKPGYKCHLRGIMGETAFLRLFPGQTRTCLVKVETNLLPDQRSRLLQFPSGLRTPSGAIDIEKELELIIGNEDRTILSVTVQYEHSLFPARTICSYQSDARISEYVQVPEGFGPMAAPSRNSIVQRRVVLHLASCQCPRQALTTLTSHFGINSNRLLCHAYIESMVEELKHRSHIQEHHAIASNSDVMTDPSDSEVRGNDCKSLSVGTIGTPLQSTSSGMTGAIAHTSSIPPTTAGSIAKDKETDMARKIWLELRRNSKSAHFTQTRTNTPGERPMKNSTFLADEWKRIQSIALKNQRSLGQDTLRSLSYAGTKTQKSAPWL